MAAIITVRVVYLRFGWDGERVTFQVQCKNNKKAIREEIVQTIGETFGLLPGGYTIYCKNQHQKYIRLESKNFKLGKEVYFTMYAMPSVYATEDSAMFEQFEVLKNNRPGSSHKIANVSTQTLRNTRLMDEGYNAADFVVHNHIFCNNCLVAPLMGFRYKCLVCVDYDLCENCEMKHVHSEHMMVRIPNDNCRGVVSKLIKSFDRCMRESYRESVMRNAESIGVGAAISPNGNNDEAIGLEREMKYSNSKGRRERYYANRNVRPSRSIWNELYNVMQNLGEDGTNEPTAPTTPSSVSDEDASPIKKAATSATTSTKDNVDKENVKDVENSNKTPKTDDFEKETTKDAEKVDKKPENANVLLKHKIKNDAMKVAQDALGVAVNQIYSATKAAELATQFMSDTITEGTISHSSSNDKEKNNRNQEEAQRPDLNEEKPSPSTSCHDDDGAKGAKANVMNDNSIDNEIGNTISAAGEAAVAVYQAFCQIMKVSSKMTGMAVNFLETVGNGNIAPTTSSASATQNNVTSTNSNKVAMENVAEEGLPETEKELCKNSDAANDGIINSMDKVESDSQIEEKTENEVNVDTNDKEKEEDNDVSVEDYDKGDDSISTSSESLVNNSDVESVSESFIKLDLDTKEQTSVEIQKQENTVEVAASAEVLDASSGTDHQISLENQQPSVEETSDVGANENRRYESSSYYHPNDRINNAVAALIRMGFSNENNYLTYLLESVDGNISDALDIIVASQH